METNDSKNNEGKLLPLFNEWIGINMETFVLREHIFMVDDNGNSLESEEVAKKLFAKNRENIFNQMSPDDKERYAYWKFLKSKNGDSAEWPKDNNWEDYDDYYDNSDDYYPTSADDINDEDYKMILPFPCQMSIESKFIDRVLMVTQTNFQEQKDDFFAFADEKLSEIVEDNILTKSGVQRRCPGITVFCWSKSQNTHARSLFQMSGGGMEGSTKRYVDTSWIDLSDFIMSLNTNVGSDAGSFSLSLPFYNTRAIQVTHGIESVDGAPVNESFGVLSAEDQNQHNYMKENFNEDERYSLFNQLISANDIIFISFSDLRKNAEESEKIANMFDSDNISTLASVSAFDMIALVDDVIVTKNSQNAEVRIEITGRDLNKLIVDDGSFFFNSSTCQDPSTVFFNEQGYSKQGDVRSQYSIFDTITTSIERFGIRKPNDGQLDIFMDISKQCVSYIIKGVVSQLANIEVVPSDVFVKWENRTKWKEIHPDEELQEIKQGHASENQQTSQDPNAGKTLVMPRGDGIEQW